jgi:hypothetical protein
VAGTFPLDIPPGVVKDATRYARKGRWISSDKIRFRNGKPEGIGGWQVAFSTRLTGVCRSILPFADLQGYRSLMFGTHSKLQLWYRESLFYDITPVIETHGPLANPISTTASSNRIGITLPGGATKVLGSYIIVSGATATGGIPDTEINAEHVIVDIVGNVVFVDVASTASSTVPAGGGTNVTVDILYPSGNQDVFGLSGWGSGGWGTGTWGGGVSGALVPIRFWSMDTWGEDVIATPSDGPIFYWDATTPSARAVAISGMPGANHVPLMARQTIVSSQTRIVLAFATNAIGSSDQDPMLLRWSDNDNYLEWDPTVPGSAAGELRFTSGSVFVTAIEGPNEILAWTDTTLHGISPTFDNSIFAMRVLSTKAHIHGPQAATIAGDAIYWYGALGFFRYAGAVQKLECPLEDFINDLMDDNRRVKTVCGGNASFSEVWWHFVSKNSPDGEPDMYVKINMVENVWDYGTLNRSAWIDRDIFPYPVATYPTGRVVFHEIGVVDASEMVPETILHSIAHGPIEIDGVGDSFTYTSWIMPDIEMVPWSGTSALVDIGAVFDAGPGDTDRMEDIGVSINVGASYGTQYRFRGRGRTVALSYSFSSIDAMVRLGITRLVGRPDGRK